MAAMSQPLRVTDLRSKIHEVVTASDAASQVEESSGGGSSRAKALKRPTWWRKNGRAPIDTPNLTTLKLSWSLISLLHRWFVTSLAAGPCQGGSIGDHREGPSLQGG